MGETGVPVAAQPNKLFYGWIVAWAGFVVLCLGFGCAYTFAAFFEPLSAESGATRGATSLVFSIAGFLYFALGAFSGPFADRNGPKRVVLAGVCLIGLGLLFASRAGSLLQVYLGYGLGVGVGIGLAYVPVVGAIQRWFVKRRAAASGLAVAGIGVGTLVMPPFASWLIGEFGWRNAYLALGLVTLVFGIAAASLIEPDPARRGLRPDGAPPADGESGPGPVLPGMSPAEAIRTSAFWLLMATFVLVAVGLFVPFVHLVPYARDHGVPQEIAVWLFGLIGVGSTAGRFLLGGLADRLGRKPALASMFLAMSALLAFWLVATNSVTIAIFALLFGLFYGGFVALGPAVIADFFGARHAGALIGYLYSGVAIGTLVGPTLAGVAYDMVGSYRLPIAVGAALTFIGALCTVFAKAPGRG